MKKNLLVIFLLLPFIAFGQRYQRNTIAISTTPNAVDSNSVQPSQITTTDIKDGTINFSDLAAGLLMTPVFGGMRAVDVAITPAVATAGTFVKVTGMSVYGQQITITVFRIN